MSTRKLSDKELDKYFRNMLKKPETIPFDEAAWQGMSEKLATSSNGGAISPWVIGSGAVALLVAIIYGILQFTGVDQSNEVLSQKSEVTEQEPVSSISEQPIIATDSLEQTEASNTELRLAESESASSSDIESKETASLAGSEPSDANLELKDANEKTTIASPNQPIDRKEPLSGSQTGSQTGDDEIGQSTIKPLTSSPPVSNVSQSLEDQERSSEKSVNQVWFINQKETDPPTEITAPQPVPDIQIPVDSSSYQDNPKLKNRITDRIRIGISLAPDFSTVEELSEFDQAGFDAGVHLEYFITDRISVTTGAILTRKIYRTTDLSEYQFPAGFWPGGDEPDQINADCKVIDIPINLRYLAIEGRQTDVFVSAGVSSYLMLTERYDYDYDDPWAVGNQWVSEFKNENQHYFGVYNLSFGIVRRIGKNISIEVEPYLKNSFGGVGWGQVQLKSTGALFHLKYHLGTQ